MTADSTLTLTVAACEYPVEELASFTAFEAKLGRLCHQAAAAGAGLLVFPEYASLELTSFLPPEVRGDLHAGLRGMQPLLPAWLEAHRRLAAELGVSILTGSWPVEEADGSFRNRAWLCAPNGETRYQDKIQMTRFESESWGISGGRDLRLMELPGGARIGVLICYDSEFPLLARRMVEAGARVLLVPSCTDTDAGFHRVMLSCRARALEQQCFVVQAPLAGEAPWSPAIDVTPAWPECSRRWTSASRRTGCWLPGRPPPPPRGSSRSFPWRGWTPSAGTGRCGIIWTGPGRKTRASRRSPRAWHASGGH